MKKKKKSDKRIRLIAKLLCKQWDDDWGLGWRFHTKNAKAILVLIDGSKK